MNTAKLSCWIWWILFGIVLLGIDCAARAQSAPDTGWPNYGNDAGGGRYSTPVWSPKGDFIASILRH